MDARVLLVLVAACWLAGWLVACRVWPYVACPRCKGTGKRRSPSGRAWRACPRCKGTGRRLRAGRLLLNWYRGISGRSR